MDDQTWRDLNPIFKLEAPPKNEKTVCSDNVTVPTKKKAPLATNYGRNQLEQLPKDVLNGLDFSGVPEDVL